MFILPHVRPKLLWLSADNEEDPLVPKKVRVHKDDATAGGYDTTIKEDEALGNLWTGWSIPWSVWMAIDQEVPGMKEQSAWSAAVSLKLPDVRKTIVNWSSADRLPYNGICSMKKQSRTICRQSSSCCPAVPLSKDPEFMAFLFSWCEGENAIPAPLADYPLNQVDLETWQPESDHEVNGLHFLPTSLYFMYSWHVPPKSRITSRDISQTKWNPAWRSLLGWPGFYGQTLTDIIWTCFNSFCNSHTVCHCDKLCQCRLWTGWTAWTEWNKGALQPLARSKLLPQGQPVCCLSRILLAIQCWLGLTYRVAASHFVSQEARSCCHQFELTIFSPVVDSVL